MNRGGGHRAIFHADEHRDVFLLEPAHGPPHVDIRRRGPYPDRKVPLLEE